jgi:signal peptidase I
VFGLFTSQEKRMRVSAAHWLELADKIFNYRRDELSTAESAELGKCTEDLRLKLSQRAEAEKLKLSVEALEPVLRRTGGKIYPKSELTEWVEFFLVAGIVLLGFRAYFVTNFQIPTNSMWPSYYGMTGEVYQTPQENPGFLKKTMRFLTFGAVHHEAIAPQSGEVAMNFFYSSRYNFTPLFTEKRSRKWLVIPTTVHEYTFYVNDTPVAVDVPEDFDLEFGKLMARVFFGGDNAAFERRLDDDVQGGRAEQVVHQLSPGNAVRAWRINLGKTVRAGESVMSFDVLAGDMLFVDRFSYHFVRPKVGSGFVFRTDDIPRIPEKERGSYFIKRLVGVPGDTLEIRQPVLYRNGRPIEGAASFQKEAQQIDSYPGYYNAESLSAGQSMTVPPGYYLALGDNSPESLDGRFWGYVPAGAVVGRPLFIYYPLTRRWGPAH